MFKLELKKAFHSNGFKIAVLLGCVLMILQSVWIYAYLEGFYSVILLNDANPSFLQAWMGTEPFSVYSNLYYYILFPLLAALPYAGSGLREQQLGYDKQMIIRVGKWRYASSKYGASFMAGGVVVTIPPLLSLMLAMSRLPMIPEPKSMGQGAVGALSLWSLIYYKNPLLYVLLYIGLDFLVGGILSNIALSFTYWMNSRFVLFITPMMANLLLVELLNNAPGIMGRIVLLVPYAYVYPIGGPATGLHIFFSMVLLFLLSSCLYFGRIWRRDFLN